MNPGIFYFYHYMPDRPPCNVGFLKLNGHFSSCSIELHIRNIPVSQGDVLKLGAFYPEDARLMAVSLCDIVTKTNAVFTKYELPETLFTKHCELSELGGFFLVLPDGNMIAATAPGITFTPKSLYFSKNQDADAAETKEQAAVPTMAPTKAKSAEPAVTLAKTESAATAAPAEGGAVLSAAGSGDEISASKDMQQQNAPAQILTVQIPTAQTTAGQNPTEQTTTTQTTAGQDPTEQTLTVQTTAGQDPTEQTTTTQTTAGQDPPVQKVRRIKRQELRVLPRKYWNLANNSFLMHGYYNYNHLLLVEKDGYYLVGVPGIYSAREANAANLFGFPRFTDEYNDKLQPAEEIQNDYGSFGYWCCEIPTPAAGGDGRQL